MPELNYLQLFADMLDDHFGVLTDEELGIIIRASMLYAFQGVLPEFEPRSVLGMTWRRMKAYIDQCQKNTAKNRENGNKGGRGNKKPTETQPNPEKPNETQQNPTKPTETQPNPTEPSKTQTAYIQDQDQDHIQDQDHKQEQYYAPAPATDNVIAFDGSDLTADIRNNQKAQELAARYLPRGRTPMEFDPRVGALAEDIGTHGAEKVEAALKEAARCDNRGGVSIAFYRTILGNLGKEKPPNKAAAGDYQHRQYTEADFKAMEVDLDAL